jgi:tetratricopeptide (TPR) repeat protein
MRKITALFLLLLTTLPNARAEQVPPHQLAFQRGLELSREGRLDEAESQFKRALEENPSNADYHFELANVYAVQHDASLKSREPERAKNFMESAARELEQAVMIRPDFIPAHFNLGVVYKKLGKYEKARAEFKDVIRLNPQSIPAMLQIGEIYEEQGFIDEAESVYRDIRDRGLYNDDVALAVENLESRKNALGRREQNQQMRSLGMNQQKLASAYAERNNPALANQYGSPYGNSNSGSSPVSSLAPLMMNSNSQRNSRDDW